MRIFISPKHSADDLIDVKSRYYSEVDLAEAFAENGFPWRGGTLPLVAVCPKTRGQILFFCVLVFGEG